MWGRGVVACVSASVSPALGRIGIWTKNDGAKFNSGERPFPGARSRRVMESVVRQCGDGAGE